MEPLRHGETKWHNAIDCLREPKDLYCIEAELLTRSILPREAKEMGIGTHLRSDQDPKGRCQTISRQCLTDTLGTCILQEG